MKKRSHNLKAFSLVELALAIGILAFCLISIMGLLPTALANNRWVMDRMLEFRIHQTIRGDLLNRPYSTLPTGGAYYFDRDGKELKNGPGDPDVFYKANFTIDNFLALPASQKNNRIATCRIEIVNVKRNESRHGHVYLPDNGY